jgi:membrane-associated phospholipid phosphatase
MMDRNKNTAGDMNRCSDYDCPVFRPVDLVIIGYQIVMSIVAIASFSHVDHAGHALVRHAVSAVGICALRVATVRWGGVFLKLLSDWYPILSLPFTYNSTGSYVHAIFPGTIDPVLYRLDAWLMGTEPARCLQSLQRPFLSDLLQLSYCSYFVIIFSSCLILFHQPQRRAFSNLRMAIVSILYGTYLSFMLLPAHGPRFVYREYFRLSGGWITQTVNTFISSAAFCGGAFPSGHAAVSLTVCALLYRYERRWFPVFAAITALLLASTVYGGYHYIVDLAAGAIFGAAVGWGAVSWNRAWHARHQSDDVSYCRIGRP